MAVPALARRERPPGWWDVVRRFRSVVITARITVISAIVGIRVGRIIVHRGPCTVMTDFPAVQAAKASV
ncbi:hypothetical protein ACIHCV_44235 [Streptomyces sp. NPDC051956]|uniref:hypothetical protein n=1 Tax=Streptomyces sp. NPDC051956 TaxID=3365677 RepID=UPI0037D52ADD